MAEPPAAPARLALVGDRSRDVQAHVRLPAIVAAIAAAGSPPIEAEWIGTGEVLATDLVPFDGIWALPGSPYVSTEGMLAAIGFARTNGVPFLGTCGGFQHMLLEWAREVCGLDVEHGEDGSGGREALIRPLSCSLFGESRTVRFVPGTRTAALMAVAERGERYFCSYGLDPRFEQALVDSGLVIAARDDEGDVRVGEHPTHPFFVGALFQPELSSDADWVHPLIVGFAEAVRAHARTRARAIR